MGAVLTITATGAPREPSSALRSGAPGGSHHTGDLGGELLPDGVDESCRPVADHGPAGELLTLSYGAGTETRTYNSLLQLTHQVVPGYMNMTYNYSATQNNGRITGSVDTVANETTAYSYDALNRLTGASNGLWSETYGYDGFGNLTSKSGTGGAPSMTATYDAQNRQSGASYDANGNLLLANGNTNIFDVENRLIVQSGVNPPYAAASYAYDPSGKRVMRWTDPDPYSYDNGSDPRFEYSFYGITGQKLIAVGCVPVSGHAVPSCSIQGQNVFFGKKELVWGGVSVVTDRLGSVRGNSQGERMSYYPYGEERTGTVDGRDKFGTYFRDSAGQDYAEQRYYGAGTGRFWSADPGIASAGNPVSLNKYAYVNGDPVNFFDPNGENAFNPDSTSVYCTGVYMDGLYMGCLQGTGGGGGYGGGGGGLCGGSGVGFLPGPDPSPACYIPPPPDPPEPARSCSSKIIAEGNAGGYHAPFAYHIAIQIDNGSGTKVDYEALPVAKTPSENPHHLPVLFGGSWLNKSRTLGNIPGTVVDVESGADVCDAVDGITAAFNFWKDNTTSYYFYPQNSNSFAHWLLDKADASISLSAALWLTTYAAGWNWVPEQGH